MKKHNRAKLGKKKHTTKPKLGSQIAQFEKFVVFLNFDTNFTSYVCTNSFDFHFITRISQQ